jgi:hypothetical protein
MPSRKKAAPVKKPGKPVAKTAKKAAPVKAAAPKQAAPKPVTAAKPVAVAAPAAPARPVVPPARPVQLAPIASAAPKPVAKPASGQTLTVQQAEERRKAATRKLFARIRSLEAIVGADLRKRGSLLLSQAVDQWYAEATSATATDVTITNAARAVISQL